MESYSGALDVNVALEVSALELSYGVSATLGKESFSESGSWAAFSKTFNLFNADLPLYNKTWELGGFSSPEPITLMA